mgnify:CR=1 FL=1
MKLENEKWPSLRKHNNMIWNWHFSCFAGNKKTGSTTSIFAKLAIFVILFEGSASNNPIYLLINIPIPQLLKIHTRYINIADKNFDNRFGHESITMFKVLNVSFIHNIFTLNYEYRLSILTVFLDMKPTTTSSIIPYAISTVYSVCNDVFVLWE